MSTVASVISAASAISATSITSCGSEPDVMYEITNVGPRPIVPNWSLPQNWFWKFVPVDPLIFYVAES